MNKLRIPAFHVLWTKPSIIAGKDFDMNEAEILTMIISALMWQKHNGTIKLYTDKVGYEFIKKHDLQKVWNGGIDTEILENNSYPIDPETFWAAGKLIALEAETCPCVMLDTDLIVLKSLHEILEKSDITALHSESIEPGVYLNPSLLKKPASFEFPAFYNWNALPSNTAFLYIKDKSFKNFYLEESKRFMFHNTKKPAEMVSQMVFAEQRLLSICAAHVNLPISHLLSDPFSLSNDSIVHLWGFKKKLRKNKNFQTILITKLIESFGEKLPEYDYLFQKLKIH